MYKNKSLGVVVPAYNEEKMISQVLNTVPEFVDIIIVVDDASLDRTSEVVLSHSSYSLNRVVLLRHDYNQGVGGAIITGYKYALSREISLVAVMAGDGQMDPDDLQPLIEPIVAGEAEYTKGNRLFRGESWRLIPHYRYLGNAVLSLLTKVASGYWHIADSQSGYTVISHSALETLNLDHIYKRYGMPNDLLIALNINNFRVKDISIRPVYNIGEVSGIKLRKVVPSISLLLLRGFFKRLIDKYIIRDFHPLIFFYGMGLTILPVGIILGSYLIWHRIFLGPVAPTSALFSSFMIISGMQSLFFAMWFDMDYNSKLR